MKHSWASIRMMGPALLMLAFGFGVLSATLWGKSDALWNGHLAAAQHKGELFFDVLENGTDLPQGITSFPLKHAVQMLAHAGEFERIKDGLQPALVTRFTINTDRDDVLAGGGLKLAIVSSRLRYPLSELDLSQVHSPRDTLGMVTALLATYCSDAVIYTSFADAPWRGFNGQQVWGCAAQPRDMRLPAVFLAVVALLFLSGVAVNASASFTDFAEQLRSRHRFRGEDVFNLGGPAELKSVINAVNNYREKERQHLADRALVLSGVTHDLGTPATRLRLRAELISDPELRRKFEADIDQMTGIIESVLTYTRAELSTEPPRQISLTSLVDALVADYSDVGRPVEFEPEHKIVVSGGQSIFMSRRGRSEVSENRPVILEARPVALQRALSNLIDNALKYGRRAIVSLETDVCEAHILIEDEGGQASFSDLEGMMAPFQRGPNALPIEGFGMGLTIASTIAIEHGGRLSFEPGKNGIVARLSIARS